MDCLVTIEYASVLMQGLLDFNNAWKYDQWSPGAVIYLDDLITTVTTPEQQWTNLENLLLNVKKYGFTIKLQKCDFLKLSVEYLGHVIDSRGKSRQIWR